MKRWWNKNALWIVGVGLMLASSGIDGVYMARWMPITILGFILNTVADIADMVLAHKYGKLQRKRSDVKRRWSVLLLFGELCAIGYSWFFSWLQLRIVLRDIEPQDWRWIAPIAAGFIPVLLAFLGFAQALDDTSADLLETDTKPLQERNETTQPLQIVNETEAEQQPRRIDIHEWRTIRAGLNGSGDELDANGVNAVLEARGLATVPPSTARYWAEDGRE